MKIGIISDIHEDSRSLETAIRILEKKNCDELVCLGDIVGFDVLYYRYLSKRDAARCVALIRDNCRYVVAGNHDFFAARRIPASNGMFPFPKDWYELDFRERERLGKGKVWLFEHQELSSLLNQKEKDFLESLPEHIVVEFDRQRILFSHSTLSRPDRHSRMAAGEFLGFPGTFPVSGVASLPARFFGAPASQRNRQGDRARFFVSSFPHVSYSPGSGTIYQPLYGEQREQERPRGPGSGEHDGGGNTVEIEEVPDRLFPMKKLAERINGKRFFLNIVLPTLLTIGFFIVLIFRFIIPYFEQNMLNQKKEMIRELISSSVSIAVRFRQRKPPGN